MPSKGLILVVEDEDAIRLTLRDYLKKKGYEVLVASDGVGAIKQLLDYEVDLIVSDYRMDVLGGEYWIKFLKKYCAGPKIVVTDYRMDVLGGDYWIKFLKRYCAEKKIVITSGFLRPDFLIPFEVVYKPFDYSELEARVAALLEGGSGETGGA